MKHRAQLILWVAVVAIAARAALLLRETEAGLWPWGS